ncbi:hypothetical protein [Niameybacter massiliensis]|uniref:hypothetical protein n=1 Tax=Niameybacter massiliensis TaxID=1658108 RepID=UPI0006B6297A|nr:hypothetical protein [Niameybacter massiliensis]
MAKLYSIDGALGELEITRNKLYALIRHGYITCIKCDTLKIPETEIDNFIEKWTGWDLTDLDNPKKLNKTEEEN